jgi:hypothetical protein
MKMNTKLITILGAAVLAATTAVAKPSASTASTVHFSIHIPLTDTGVEPGSAGTVSANEVKQGSKLNQNLVVTVSGLTSDTDYTLNAVTGGGTVDLKDFTTDGNGKATVHLNSNSKGGGTNSPAFPDSFELATVTEFDVVGSGGTVLTTADTTPNTVQYSVKKSLTSSDTSSGTLQIKANTKKTTLNINASGLTPDTDYDLVENGNIVQTYTADSKGRLKIKAAPTPDNILDLNTVEIQQGGTTILSTTLP